MYSRVEVNIEDLKKQLKLSKSVITILEQSVETYNQIDKKLKDSIEALSKEISDSLKNMKTIVNAISNVFAGLVTDVQSADTDLSQGQYELFEEYKIRFEEILKRWKNIQSRLRLNY